MIGVRLTSEHKIISYLKQNKITELLVSSAFQPETFHKVRPEPGLTYNSDSNK